MVYDMITLSQGNVFVTVLSFLIKKVIFSLFSRVYYAAEKHEPGKTK